jgi:Zn ribbon nucleic-acid-binding protein
MKKTGAKKVFVATIRCPNCEGIIEVLKEIEILIEPVKGKKKEHFFAEKSVQTTLSE